MTGAEGQIETDEPLKADHLCVLIHGLWGNPNHLWYLRQALEEKYGEDQLHILVATRNSDTFTYDGIEVGAERVVQEIEEKLEQLASDGTHIIKLSMVGYSLGGLISRYAIGLLYSRGWFNQIRPINFTTFATPHLGVRSPLRTGVVFNIFGARTLSTSGRQLFLTDSFRDHGRPLLSLLADSNSIFIKALHLFKHRSLYANIINDRSAPFFTTAISSTDPFEDLEAVRLEYLKGYEPIVLDPHRPIVQAKKDEELGLYTWFVNSSSAFLTKVPLYAMLTILVPVGAIAFIINSGVQSVRSNYRIRLHETGKAGIGYQSYRIPLMVENARHAVEDAIEDVNAQVKHDHFSNEHTPVAHNKQENQERKPVMGDDASSVASTDPLTTPLEFPKLSLVQEQFDMIQTLDEVGFRKYLIHIHKVRHSHAAIVVRHQKETLDEGKVVVRHWLAEEFEI